MSAAALPAPDPEFARLCVLWAALVDRGVCASCASTYGTVQVEREAGRGPFMGRIHCSRVNWRGETCKSIAAREMPSVLKASPKSQAKGKAP